MNELPPTISRYNIIDLPHHVKDERKALSLLGGLHKIQAAFDKQQKLQLRFNPQNPNGVFLNATEKKSVRLLLRVRRKRGTTGLEYLCFGICSRVFVFEELATFSYLPFANKPDGSVESLMEKIYPRAVGDLDFHVQTDVPFFVPPFAWQHVFSDLLYQFDLSERSFLGSLKVKVQRTAEEQDDDESKLKIKLKAGTQIRFADDPLPTGPSEQTLSNLNSLNYPAEYLKQLEDLFELKPVWAKQGLLRRVVMPPEALKFILPKFAYVIPNGPFNRTWARFGYDPWMNSEARHWQMIELRFRQFLKPENIKQLKAMQNQRNSISAEEASRSSRWLALDSLNLPPSLEADPEVLDERFFPTKASHYFQIEHIRLQSVRELLDSVSEETGKTCIETDGWFPAGTIQSLRTKAKEVGLKNMDLLRQHYSILDLID